MQTLTRRGVGDAAAGLGLHFLHMSEGPFSHDAGHLGDGTECNPTHHSLHLSSPVLFVPLKYVDVNDAQRLLMFRADRHRSQRRRPVSTKPR